jgi:plasmid maintenance system antidote protein VapI
MKGLRIADLAAQIGVHRSVIYKIISGDVQSPKVAAVLYRKLGCTRRMKFSCKQ